jgi:mxaA protein
MERRLTWYVGAFAATLALWLAWWLWRQWRASSSQPFARAKRAMRKLDDAAPAAWLALHRAFDETAGEALQSATVADLFERAPQLIPLRDRIENFYAQSNARFFTSGQPVDSLPVHKLCAELRRIEKRHEA